MSDSNFVVKNGLVVNGAFSANSTQFSLGSVSANTTAIIVGANYVNTTYFTGTSSNSTLFSGQSLSTVQGWITSNSSAAYSNATSYAASIAATAYSNAVSYANSIAITAYSNAISYAASIAATAYSNAVSYAPSKTGSGASGTWAINISGSAATISGYTINQNLGTGNDVQFNSVGVGTAGSGTTGEIRATNQITAYYSDRRLKTDITPIPDAINKVMQISGVTFRSNEVAEQFGYTDKKLQVGVIAQEIESVLPEIVVAAPFDIAEDGSSKSGENYKTVHYEKIVPLLIEAIKEQQKQIEELKNRG